MDVLIFVVIFGILPQIIKGVAKSQDKRKFESDDIENVKNEFEKVKARFKDFKISSALESLGAGDAYRNIENVETEKSNIEKVSNNRTTKTESDSIYEKKTILNENRKASVEESKAKVKFKDKEDLKRAVIMSEILGKPKALKDQYR